MCDTISESHSGLSNPLVVLLEIKLPNKFQTFHEKVLLGRTAEFPKLFSTSSSVGELPLSACNRFLI